MGPARSRECGRSTAGREPVRAAVELRRDRPEVERIEVVVDRGDGQCFAGALDDDLVGRTQGGIERELACELTIGGKLDQLAGLACIRVDRVVTRHEQVAARCQRQADGPVEVCLILVNKSTRSVIRSRLASVLDGENLVVAGCGDVESVVLRVVDQAARANGYPIRARLGGRLDRNGPEKAVRVACEPSGKKERVLRARSAAVSER
jgi:hypothetical protein